LAQEKATNYCNELVVKVKVHKDDLSALVHNGGKIRCTKLNYENNKNNNYEKNSQNIFYTIFIIIFVITSILIIKNKLNYEFIEHTNCKTK
jgi:hypothetical protein